MSNLFPISRFNLGRPITGDFETMLETIFNTPLRNTHSEDSFYSMPRANVSKDNESYTIYLAAPGYSREDFEITVENNTLTISCSGENHSGAPTNTYTSREYSYTSFSRSWALPKGVSVDNINARYDAGILAVNVPTADTGETTVTVNVE